MSMFVSKAIFYTVTTALGTAGATIYWDIPTLTADLNPLTDLIGFYIYRGAGNVAFAGTSIYRDDIGPLSSSWTDISPLSGFASYYVTAVDADNNEGAPSAQILKIN